MTSALVPHRGDPRTIQARRSARALHRRGVLSTKRLRTDDGCETQAACTALGWIVRAKKADAAPRAAKLAVPKLLVETIFPKIANEPFAAVRAGCAPRWIF